MDFNDFVLFVRNLYDSNEFIPLHAPVFINNEKKYLEECIDSTFVSSIGKFVHQFEDLTLDYTGSKYAIATVNGTAALHIALLICGVNPEDEVITQPITFISTVNAIIYCNAKPIFIDIENSTLGLSPEKLESFLSQNTKLDNNGFCINKQTGRRIKACVPMHTFGFPCKIDQIAEICLKYNIELIEDSAESLGSFFKDKHTATFGRVGIISYNGNKVITTGGGGMIITNDASLAKKAKHLTTQAKVPHPWNYVHDNIGYNYRLPNINAALGCAQMESLSEIIKNKRLIAKSYSNFFSNSDIRFINEPLGSIANYWLNAIILKDRKERDRFLEFTNKNNVMTRPVWHLISKLEMFKKCQTGDLTNSEWLENRIVNIPSSVNFKSL